MTGRRPFWDRSHDTELIINICDGLRPPIVTNAPNGYIELMEECWHSDPEKRPHATDIYDKIDKIYKEESKNCDNKNPTEIVKSSDIGPVTNNPNAIYKSRNLSGMIQSAISLRSSRSQSINLELFNYYQKNNMGPTGKRKYENDLTEDKKDNDYITNELELDIDINISNEYITVENDFDISF
uniref:Serine-threonine/tyrosine-protein kinase catalytic domain-containing protein n=1 Tax=Rhizophagus irregularis (strain DAOM 181602 / DAOM 197198 / MUCL 43194) TaxID=747089 RepID=U9T085_RHIID